MSSIVNFPATPPVCVITNLDPSIPPQSMMIDRSPASVTNHDFIPIPVLALAQFLSAHIRFCLPLPFEVLPHYRGGGEVVTLTTDVNNISRISDEVKPFQLLTLCLTDDMVWVEHSLIAANSTSAFHSHHVSFPHFSSNPMANYAKGKTKGESTKVNRPIGWRYSTKTWCNKSNYCPMSHQHPPRKTTDSPYPRKPLLLPVSPFHANLTQAGGLYVHSVEKVMSSVVLRRCENA